MKSLRMEGPVESIEAASMALDTARQRLSNMVFTRAARQSCPSSQAKESSMKKSLHAMLAVALALTAQAALAQEAGADGRAAKDRGARAEQARAAFDKRFAEADADADGKLSRAEAEAKMPRVAESFDTIDTAKTGFVTKEQVGKHMMKMAAEHRGKQKPAN